jgi:AcrR family transcriptional regulator
MNQTNSVLAAQSQEWILQALLFLMEKKSFKDITVKELAEKAGLDRKTFYRHFESKDDVLRFHMDKIYQDYIDELQKYETLTSYIIGLSYFSVMKKHLSFFKKLEKNNLMIFLLSLLDTYLPELHKQFETDKADNDDVSFSEYATSYYTGGFWNLSVRWIRNGAKQSPKEMAAIVEKVKSKA